MGDRPIQVGSRAQFKLTLITLLTSGTDYHFSETNRQLAFDRKLALFKRLDIAAGTAVRFEPGETKTVVLVEIAGDRRIKGGSNLASHLQHGAPDHELDVTIKRLVDLGFAHVPLPLDSPSRPLKPFEISREVYASMFGPTTGDQVRLGDMNLWVKVERDLTAYGDECKFGGGKTLRDGMGQKTDSKDADTLDLVLTNALIIDWSGIYKADIGVQNGIIVGIGKAGNPDVMASVTPGMIVGVNTEGSVATIDVLYAY